MSVTQLRRPAAATPDRTAAARAELAARIKAYADAQTEIGAMEIALETGHRQPGCAGRGRAARCRSARATGNREGQRGNRTLSDRRWGGPPAPASMRNPPRPSWKARRKR